MTLEELVNANTTAVEKNTGMLTEVLAALGSNTELLKAVQEGRAEAIAKLTEKPAPATRSRTKKKDEEPEKDEAKEETAEPKKEETASWEPDLSPEGMRAAFGALLVPDGKQLDDETKKKEIAKVHSILAELGVESVNPAEGKSHIESDDDKRKAVFYVSRFAAGLPVDFKADYDFNEDPLTQAVPDKEEPADDLIG